MPSFSFLVESFPTLFLSFFFSHLVLFFLFFFCNHNQSWPSSGRVGGWKTCRMHDGFSKSAQCYIDSTTTTANHQWQQQQRLYTCLSQKQKEVGNNNRNNNTLARAAKLTLLRPKTQQLLISTHSSTSLHSQDNRTVVPIIHKQQSNRMRSLR